MQIQIIINKLALGRSNRNTGQTLGGNNGKLLTEFPHLDQLLSLLKFQILILPVHAQCTQFLIIFCHGVMDDIVIGLTVLVFVLAEFLLFLLLLIHARATLV